MLFPVQVGAALSDRHFEGFLHDDAGDNISGKNRSYCELTAQYWAWKNVDADYYGFFHYRRYLYPDPKARRPYRIDRCADLPLLQKLGYDRFAELIGNYDLIAPMGENMHIPVREHYASAKYHHGADLELAETIVRERHPAMVPAMEAYLSGTVCYFGNIYIMKKQVFHDYCCWVFSILEEFDRRADLSGYSGQELRVDGYLAERLFGIWLLHVQKNLRVCALPKTHFEQSRAARAKKKVLNLLLPPGSKLRALIKGLNRS